MVDGLQSGVNRRVILLLVTLPERLSIVKPKIQVVKVVMHWQVVIPFCKIELYDINNDLKGHDDDLEVEIKDEIVHFNSILLGHYRLFVENPKQKHKEH